MADAAHEITEDIIKAIEERMNKEYAQAVEEVDARLKDYLRRFDIKDKQWKKWVQEEKRTEEEYKQWRVGQMAIGTRWENMKDALARDYHNTNQIAKSIAYGYMPEVYAVNHNYATYEVEKSGGIDTSYTLYNRETVERLVRENPQLLPDPGAALSNKISNGLDVRWNRQQIQSVMLQSILQGESIPKIASRLAYEVGEKNRKAAIRNARTMATNAQNAGRYDGYRRAKGMGIDLTIEWAAVLDSRTRHEHRMLHGQRREVDEPFVVDNIEILYPAQIQGAGSSDIPQRMIWNCRCTLLAWVKGFEKDTIKQSSKMDGMSFEEWQHAKEKTNPIDLPERKAASARQDYVNEYREGRPGPNDSMKQVRMSNAELLKQMKEAGIAKAVEKSGGSGIIQSKGMEKYVDKEIIKTDNKSVREWYVANVSKIPEKVDQTLPLAEQAKQAFEMRNALKHEARVAMSDTEMAKRLEERRPAPQFESLLQDKMRRKGLTEKEALQDILATSAKTNADVNKEFGL